LLKRYLITDPLYYGESEREFQKSIERANGFDFILYRDKNNPNYKKFARIFAGVLKERGVREFLIHQNVELAQDLNAFGVHLSSQQFNTIIDAKKSNLFTIISCHSFRDIEIASGFGVDAVTFSPIFKTPNKGEPKGIETLQKVVETFPEVKIFALGGIISKVEVNKLSRVKGLFGFSSIRFFI